jgi:signal transduction histidine kinase
MTKQDNNLTSGQNNFLRIINLGAISLLVIIFYIGNYHFELEDISKHWWADAAWTLASLATGVRCIITARKLDGHYRKAWMFIGYACLAWFAGMLAWDYQELVLHKAIPFPGISDIGFILFAPLLLTGMLYYRSETPSLPLTIKQISELGVIFCAIIITMLIVLFEPIASLNESRLYLVTALAYPVLYMGLFFFSMIHPFIKANRNERVIVTLLLIGIGTHAFTNTLYAYSLLGKSYDIGHYLDVFWLIGFGFIYWSAFEQSEVSMINISAEKTPRIYEKELEALIPAIVVAWIGLFVFFFSENITAQMTSYIFPVVIGMALFMALLGWSNHRVQRKLYLDIQFSKEKLTRAYNELDQRVIQRTKELEIAKNEAEYASKAKSMFLSRMSHELRTPLNAVLGFAQLLELDDKRPLTPMQQENVKEILDAGRHLLDLINEVLDLARVESGKFELNLEKLSINSTIKECIRLMKPIADRENINLTSTLETQDTYINADRVRFKQILINLLSNAIKFNNSQGSVSIQTKTIDGDMINISISDTGTGIADEHHKHIFNPFSRFDQSNIDGFGIGLSVVKQLTEAMHGNIDVKSKPGQGSTFSLEFKLATD